MKKLLAKDRKIAIIRVKIARKKFKAQIMLLPSYSTVSYEYRKLLLTNVCKFCKASKDRNKRFFSCDSIIISGGVTLEDICLNISDRTSEFFSILQVDEET